LDRSTEFCLDALMDRLTEFHDNQLGVRNIFGTDNQLVQTTNVEMGRGSSLKIIRGLQVCINSLRFLLMHLLGSNNQLKGEWHFAF